MTIDEDIEMLEYIRQDFRGCRQGVALQDAIDTMRKYQKIEDILKDDTYYEEYANNAEKFIVSAICEVVEDGKID